jgi:hypothetical protein
MWECVFALLFALATAQIVSPCAEFNGNCVDCVESPKCEFVPSSSVCRSRLIVPVTPVPPIDGGRLTKMFQKRQLPVRTASLCPVSATVSRFTKFDLTLEVPVKTLTLRVPISTTTTAAADTVSRPTTSAPSFSEAPVLVPTTTIFRATPAAKATITGAGANAVGGDKDVDATDVGAAGDQTNWAAIGGAIGGVVVLLAIGLAAFFIVKGRKALRDSAAPPQVRAPAALPAGSDIIIGQYDTVPGSVVEKTPLPPKDRPAAALPMYQSASLVGETGTDDDTYVQLALHA